MRSESLWIVTGRIGNALILLFSLRVMTSLLEPTEYSLLAILTAFQSFAGIVLISPVGNYLNRHIHEWHDSGNLDEEMRALSPYWLAAGILTAVVAALWFWLSRGEQTAATAITVGLAVGLAIYAVTQHGVTVNRLNMLGKRRESVVWQLASSSLGLIFSAAFTQVESSAIYWLVGQGLGAWLAYYGARKVLVDGVPPIRAYQRDKLRSLFRRTEFKRFCLPLAAVATLIWMEGNGYRFLLERTWSPEALAFFLLGLSVPAQMSALLESIVTQLVFPYFFRSLAGNTDMQQRQRAVGSMAELLLPLYLMWTVFLVVGSPYVLVLIADPRYHPATQWVLFGALAELARLTGNVWQLAAQAEKDFAAVLAPFAIGAAGVLGAGLASASLGLSPLNFAVLMLLALYVKAGAIIRAMWRLMPIRLPWRRVVLAVLMLVLSGVVSHWLPRAEAPLAALVYLMAAFVIVSITMAIHIRTSFATRYLFSFQLRGRQ